MSGSETPRTARRGDGHSVIVLPGWYASDASTFPLRSFLRLRGYRARGWGLGRNPGLERELLDEITARTEREYATTGRPVSLVGWSLGGIYARAVARVIPEAVRCVITLGSPIQRGSRPPGPPPVPSTAIYSEEDRIVPARYARETPGKQTESVRVSGGHLGLGTNPFVLEVIADRLAQDPRRWQPFAGRSSVGPAASLAS